MEKKLQIVIGDATLPEFTTPDKSDVRIIIHICNDINRWGKGFVLPLGDRYPAARLTYLKSAAQTGYHELGSITHCPIDPTLSVINMVAQRGITKDPKSKEPPIRYPELIRCLQKVRSLLASDYADRKVSIHMPKIGCGLAGGDWNVVSEIIDSELVAHGLDCTVYIQR